MILALISPRGVGMGSKEHNTRTSSIYSGLSGIESLKELMSCPNAPLLTIAAMAKPYFDEIVYIDEEIDEIDFSKFYDVVGMSYMTQQATRAYELAARFSDLGSYTICGGMHPTNLPGQTLKYFDSIFIGECEETFYEFITDFTSGTPKRIYTNYSVIDMKSVAAPDYSIIDLNRYRTIPIQISRGCPHNCAFCASTKVYGAKYRHKSVEQILMEIETIRKFKKYPHIYFTDDNMLVNKKFSLELLSEMKGSGIKWMTHTDISVAENKDILKLLHQSGCRKLVIGFESIEPDSLKAMEKWKYNRLIDYDKSIENIQSHGVGVWGTFIVGLDGDNKDIFQKVIDFTIRNNLYGAMISVPTPFPGSDLFKQLEDEKRILTDHWGSYTLWNVVVEPKNMTVKELEDGFEYTLKNIYSKEAVKRRMEYFKNIFVNLGK